MKRLTNVALSFLIAAVSVPAGFSQSRPRRVGQTPPQTQQRPVQQPQADDASVPARPARPPVLGGANRDPNEQKPAATSTQDAGPEELGEGDILRVDTTLVSIPVSVMDRDGKFIPNLGKEDFRIWEDGVEQRVAYFASTEKPFTVALVIDTSGSTKSRLTEIQDAAITFVEQLRADDRVMVVSFSDQIRVLAHATNDRATLRNAIRQTDTGNGTKLYDAVDMVINEHFNRIQGRKAMVLFTDGVDTTSNRGSYDSTLRDAEELDALIYPVHFDTYDEMVGGGWPGGRRSRRGGGSSTRRGGSGGIIEDLIGIIISGGTYDPSNPNSGGNYPGSGRRGGNRRGGGGSGTTSEEYELADRYLNDLARVTGARLYKAEQQDLDSAFRMVAEELRRQYSLGYYPKNKPNAGERRGIKVRVNRTELVVRTRDSYVFQPGANAPVQATQPKPPVLKKDFVRGR